ncbi:hypothetical protein MASR1M50_24160 [Burkholderiales bacterium]
MPDLDLRDFLARLEAAGELRRIREPVSPRLEMTALSDRVLRAGGPALLFENPAGHRMPVLTNLFGTPARVARALGLSSLAEMRAFGEVLAQLKEPEPPRGMKDLWGRRDLLKTLWRMAPAEVRRPPCQQIVWEGGDVDLGRLPIQHCWPGDVAPLITWGLTITRGPHKPRQNLGIYRQQVIGRNQLIVRWLSHRGGALDFAEHGRQSPGQPYPVAVAIGADPATLLGAVTPVPDSLSEYQFAGLLRGARTEVAPALGVPLQVPARAEIVLEGHIHPDPDAPQRLAARAGRSLRRPHRLLQRARRVPGAHGGTHHPAPGCDLPQHLHRQAAGRAGHAGAGAQRGVRAAAATRLPRDHRLLPAARGVQLSHGGGAHPQGLRRPRAARDDGRVEPPAPVPLHQVRRRGG